MSKAAVDNVQVVIDSITDLVIRTRVKDGALITTLQFQARIPVPGIARVLDLQRRGVPITATIASPQAAMDLDTEEAE